VPQGINRLQNDEERAEPGQNADLGSEGSKNTNPMRDLRVSGSRIGPVRAKQHDVNRARQARAIRRALDLAAMRMIRHAAVWAMRHRTGVTTRLRMVETATPPITVSASG
jgi:hypothetical protein